MPATLLAASDIHLGRRPSRLPDDLAELGLDPSEVTPAAAWKSAVRVAIERDVDAVLLAGDVVESLADRFRALRVIEEGVELLLS
ncbi:MAG: DNA repair exonuclease, partial [Acidobacteriota bacterium]|nr:DNA repair exonuclease [Acidobacteriota bacterium]